MPPPWSSSTGGPLAPAVKQRMRKRSTSSQVVLGPWPAFEVMLCPFLRLSAFSTNGVRWEHGITARPRVPDAPDEAPHGGGGGREQGSQKPEQVEAQEEGAGAGEHGDSRGEEDQASTVFEASTGREERVQEEARGGDERRKE